MIPLRRSPIALPFILIEPRAAVETETTGRQHGPRPRIGRARGAFTLIELLVVIAIIAVLAAMLLPVLGKARKRAYRVQCMSNQKQLYLGSVNYASDMDDGLPNSGFSNGGDGRDLAGIEFPSARTWVVDYLNITLYTSPRQFGGVPSKNVSAALSFGAGNMRSFLSCPSSDSEEANYRYNTKQFDYWPVGFGAYYRGNNAGQVPLVWSRLSRAGATQGSAPKAFIIDHCFTQPVTGNAFFFYKQINCHSPRNIEGMNVTAGDGSVAWVTDLVPYAESKWAVPKGYYTQTYWVSWGSPLYQSLIYFNPNGGQTVTRTNNSTAGQYAKAMEWWY